MDFLAPFLFFLVPVSLILCVVFVLIAVFQEAKKVGRAKAIGNAFVYIFSLLSTLAVAGALTFLGFLLLRAGVFKDAFYSGSEGLYTPPSLYFSSVPDKPLEDTLPSVAVCTEQSDCTLTSQQRTDIDRWLIDYNSWKSRSATSAITRRGLVNDLSVLVVAVPLLILFLWLFGRVRKTEHKESNLPPVYYYGLGFASLAVLAVSIGLLINVGLKSWLLSPSDTLSKPYTAEISTEITELQKCQDACNLSPEVRSALDAWQKDYDAVITQTRDADPYADDLAATIPLIIMSAVVCGYHLLAIRRDKKA